MNKFLIPNFRDTILRINVNNIVFISADGNFINIHSKNKMKAMVGMTLQEMEHQLADYTQNEYVRFARIGRTAIINLQYVYQIIPQQQTIILSDQATFSFTLKASRDALRKLKEAIAQINV